MPLIPLAVVILTNRAGEVLLHLRAAHAPRHPDHWALPGGGTEETLRRFLAEG